MAYIDLRKKAKQSICQNTNYHENRNTLGDVYKEKSDYIGEN